MTGEFLGVLFTGKRDNDHLLIWLKDKAKGGTSHWFTNLEQAEAFAVQNSGKFDVYEKGSKCPTACGGDG